MAFDFRCLPPHMQRQALQKMLEQNKTASVEEKQPKRNKYNNTSSESNGIKFDSKKEAKRYEELMLLLKAGQIEDLKLQENFTLQEGYTTPDGERIRSIVYKADFTYKQGGERIVEDVKSTATKTKTYIIKKKMMLNKFGIAIKEI